MATEQQPAGWYPDPQVTGQQRYWDGFQWTEQTAPAAAPAAAVDPYQQSRSVAMWSHLSGLLGFLGPLIFYFVKKDEDAFVGDQAREALNFHLTLMIGYLICIPLMFLLIGLILFPVLYVAGVVLSIVAAVAANKGEWY